MEGKRKPRGPYGLYKLDTSLPIPRSTLYSQARRRRISAGTLGNDGIVPPTDPMPVVLHPHGRQRDDEASCIDNDVADVGVNSDADIPVLREGADDLVFLGDCVTECTQTDGHAEK